MPLATDGELVETTDSTIYPLLSFPDVMAPATIFTFEELKGTSVTLVPWRVLQDGTQLAAPRFNDLPLILDLTPGEDTWLKPTTRDGPSIDYLANLKKHHAAAETVACKFLLDLPPELAGDVARLDKQITRLAMHSSETKSVLTGLNWMPMLRDDTSLMVSLILDGSDALTKLYFISQDGTVQQGEGLEFFQKQLGDATIDDFCCKIWAEMQFINVQQELNRKSVAVKVHSMALTKAPKEEVASFTQDHIDSFVRAAKRIRVNRL